MTKQILLAAVIATLTFAGCSQVSKTADAVKDTVKSATEKVTSKASDSVDSNKSAATDKVDVAAFSVKVDASEASLKVGDVVETTVDDASASAAATLLTSSSMTDMATDKVVEVADAKTDGAASKVIDAVK